MRVRVNACAPDHDALDHALERAAGKRRPATLRERKRTRHHPLLIEIHLNIRIGLLGQAENALWIRMHFLHELFEREFSLADSCQHKRKCRFQTGKTGRRTIAVLFGKQVRSVIGADDVHVFDVLPEIVTIVDGCQMRLDDRSAGMQLVVIVLKMDIVSDCTIIHRKCTHDKSEQNCKNEIVLHIILLVIKSNRTIMHNI